MMVLRAERILLVRSVLDVAEPQQPSSKSTGYEGDLSSRTSASIPPAASSLSLF